jgi:peptidoglycan/LPS O-acetylase OafA/YrhL
VTTESRQHVPELDWLKGFAILAVMWIHSKPFDDSLLFVHLINRAVPIFLVLFGISSELWWQREGERAPEGRARRWLRGRLRRLLPGYWGLMALWWLAVLILGEPVGATEFDGLDVALSFFGYAPWVGTAWFVTIILQYVLLFPGLRWVTERVPAGVCLAAGAVSTLASIYSTLHLVELGTRLFGSNVPPPGWYYSWIFFPRALWNVTVGIYVARWWQGRVSKSATAVAAVLTVTGIVAVEAIGQGGDFLAPLRAGTVAHVVDVPLAVTLLGLLRWVALPAPVRRFLAWCGVRSWGLYLGHLLVHEIVQLGGYFFSVQEQSIRIIYGVFLLAGGVTVMTLAARLDTELRRWIALRRAASAP